jgi:MFS family permease
VLGTGALVAGFALAAMTLGWPLAASLAGRVYLRIGFRDTALIGALAVIAGSLLVVRLTAESAVLTVAASTFVVGVGLGLLSAPTIVAVQSVVDWQRRGVVTATNMFARNLGSAVGVAVFGAIANTTLANRFADAPAELPANLREGSDAERLVVQGGDRPGPVADFVRSALFDASHHVFVGIVVAAVLGFAVLWLMPRRTEPV